MKWIPVALAMFALSAPFASPAVNADSVTIQDFEKRVADYLQMRKGIESQLTQLKSTPSQEEISHHENDLGRAVREARNTAKPGDIFSPEIGAEFRRLISIAMQAGGKHIAQSLRHAEPVQLHLSVNQSYPDHTPRQSMPPSLIENLPRLPQDIEYRVTGRDLLLLDTKANLVIDVLTGVFS
jgi:hypothetical protein